MAKQPKARNERLDIYSALAVSHANIEGCLRQLKQPINQGKATQERLIEDLKKFVTELYNNVKISVKASTIKNDPSGVLTNETIYSTLDRTKKEFPHWHLVPAIIQNLIDTDEDPVMTKKSNTAQKQKAVATTTVEPQVVDLSVAEIVESVAKAQESNAVTVDGLSELDANQTETIIPEHTQQELVKEMSTTPNQVEIKPEVTTQQTVIAQAVNPEATVTETVAIPMEYDVAFHLPFYADIEKTLATMNDAFDGEELIALRSELGIKVRAWADAFYKSLHDIENPVRIKVDKAGILTATTKYSQPELHAKYDNAHMVDKILAKVNEKYKKTNTEASVHAMATAISGAQNEEFKSFEVPTAEGESVIVHKETGDVQAKKDGKVVAFFKGVYKGIKSFFTNIWKQMKRFGAWIKSWFVKTEAEDRIDVSPEEAKKMEQEAIAKAQAIAASGKVATPVHVVLPATA